MGGNSVAIIFVVVCLAGVGCLMKAKQFATQSAVEPDQLLEAVLTAESRRMRIIGSVLVTFGIVGLLAMLNFLSHFLTS